VIGLVIGGSDMPGFVTVSADPRCAGGRRSVGALLAAGVLSALTLAGVAVPPAQAASERSLGSGAASDVRSAGSVSVPVLGQVQISAGRDATAAVAVAIVHGVRRVAGGTVLYWSLGVPAASSGSAGTAGAAGTAAPSVFNFLQVQSLRDRFGSSSTPFGTPQLVDGLDHKTYTTLVDGPQGSALASPVSAYGLTRGTFYVYYDVLPPLPAGVRTVDVVLGHNDVVPSVPVQDGPMTPAVPQNGPIQTGTAWPQIDLAAVAASYQPSAGIYPWFTEDQALDNSSTTRESPAKVSVDLSADVLFAVDSDQLTPAAQGALRRAAATVNARAGGAVSITGYTDSTGTTAHNDDLSRRRAQSVAAALKPLVTAGGITFAVSGRGESDPVASNDTADGRRQNRRVSVSFTPKAG
jgi:OOP family OmpA-OmpF porin